MIDLWLTIDNYKYEQWWWRALLRVALLPSHSESPTADADWLALLAAMTASQRFDKVIANIALRTNNTLTGGPGIAGWVVP